MSITNFLNKVCIENVVINEKSLSLHDEKEERDGWAQYGTMGTFMGRSVEYQFGYMAKQRILENKDKINKLLQMIEKDKKTFSDILESIIKHYPSWHDTNITKQQLMSKLIPEVVDIIIHKDTDRAHVEVWMKPYNDLYGGHSVVFNYTFENGKLIKYNFNLEG